MGFIFPPCYVSFLYFIHNNGINDCRRLAWRNKANILVFTYVKALYPFRCSIETLVIRNKTKLLQLSGYEPFYIWASNKCVGCNTITQTTSRCLRMKRGHVKHLRLIFAPKNENDKKKSFNLTLKVLARNATFDESWQIFEVHMTLTVV